MDKKTSRLRRAKRARAKISELGANRLVVHRTPRHIYAQEQWWSESVYWPFGYWCSRRHLNCCR
jgi:hypothetical protein